MRGLETLLNSVCALSDGRNRYHEAGSAGWRFTCAPTLLAAYPPGPYFPFVSVAAVPKGPFGPMGVEDPYGVLPNIPYCILGLVLFTHRGNQTRSFHAFCGSLFLATAATAITVACFSWVVNRYMLDFVPGFVLLASVGLLALTAGRPIRPMLRTCTNAIVIGLFSTPRRSTSSQHSTLLRAVSRGISKALQEARSCWEPDSVCL